MKQQLRKDLLARHHANRLKAKAMSSASELASLLSKAYLIRVQADYKPESIAKKSGNNIVLGTTKTSDAANWPKKAEFHKGIILDVAKEIGLI